MFSALLLSAALASAPLYYDRPLTRADLDGRSLRELALMRNWIWARGGNTFRKQWLADFFKQQSWYAPLKKLDDSKISEIDKKNSAFIADYEAQLPKARLEAERADLLKSGKDPIELRLVSVTGPPSESSRLRMICTFFLSTSVSRASVYFGSAWYHSSDSKCAFSAADANARPCRA